MSFSSGFISGYLLVYLEFYDNKRTRHFIITTMDSGKRWWITFLELTLTNQQNIFSINQNKNTGPFHHNAASKNRSHTWPPLLPLCLCQCVFLGSPSIIVRKRGSWTHTSGSCSLIQSKHSFLINSFWSQNIKKISVLQLRWSMSCCAYVGMNVKLHELRAAGF